MSEFQPLIDTPMSDKELVRNIRKHPLYLRLDADVIIKIDLIHEGWLHLTAKTRPWARSVWAELCAKNAVPVN